LIYEYYNQSEPTTVLQPERPLSAIFIKRSFYKCFHISELLKTQKLVTFSMTYSPLPGHMLTLADMS